MSEYDSIDDIPRWELDAIAEIEIRWGIDGTEAENFLVQEGVFQ